MEIFKEEKFENYQFDFPTLKTKFKNRREEIVDKFVQSINQLRKDTSYKPITHKEVALRLNFNKFLSKSDDECEELFRKCESKQNFSFFFYCCPLYKTKKLDNKSHLTSSI